MSGTLKHKGLIWLLIVSSFIAGCGTQAEPEAEQSWNEIRGNTQGTTYGIILEDPDSTVDKAAIDSILHDFDLSLSTYIDSSLISLVNRSEETVFDDPFGYFQACWEVSQNVFTRTQGAFDPTVYPLVQAWGFFGDALQTPSQDTLDAILTRVGFDKCALKSAPNKKLQVAKVPHARMDFNAVAQGYAVDVLAAYLDEHKIRNYYVEIGGEIVVKGTNREGVKWRLGIDAPKFDGQRELENIVHLTNKAIATSGNYRKYYEQDGVKYAHTIDPTSGKPVQHSLLSATVIAESCAEADAYATAFMVMGVQKTLDFIEENAELNLDVYLLYDDGSGNIERAMSKGFKNYLK